MQLLCISYLTPQEKVVFAKACRETKRLAEDPLLLLEDYKSNKELSIKQLSIIFDRERGPLKSEIHKKIDALKDLHQFLSNKSKAIFEEINKVQTKGKKVTSKEKWHTHFAMLCGTECILEKTLIDFPKAPLMQFFNQHIDFLKSQGLKLNDYLYLKDDPPLHKATTSKCEILI